MVEYRLQVDDAFWEEWKDTVPRSKTLNDRLVELMRADVDGRVEG